jgi:NADPH:quinone reductase-like Zn-dependent oxidoreductase
LESSGIVEKVGAEVKTIKVGDRVVVPAKSGNYAEIISRAVAV